MFRIPNVDNTYLQSYYALYETTSHIEMILSNEVYFNLGNSPTSIKIGSVDFDIL